VITYCLISVRTSVTIATLLDNVFIFILFFIIRKKSFLSHCNDVQKMTKSG